MRIKMLVLALLAVFVSDVAMAQGGGQRRPREPQNTVPPLVIGPRSAPMQNIIPPALTPDNTWVLDLSNGGRVQVQLRPDIAPHHVERIRTLTAQGFYNGIAFHRVIDGFMAQGGDPQGNGTGGSSLPDLEAEFNDLPHLRGTLSMARTQSPNSANSQFFIMFVPRMSMDHDYTVFGRVVSGMNFVDQIVRGEPPAEPTLIIRASMGNDNVPPPTAAETAAVMARYAAPPAAAVPPPGTLTGPAVPPPPTERPATAQRRPGAGGSAPSTSRGAPPQRNPNIPRPSRVPPR